VINSTFITTEAIVTTKNVLVLVPARFASTRFPGKPLAMIKGKTLIQRVVENLPSSTSNEYSIDVAVVTDNQDIENHVKSIGGNVIRVDDNVPTGSERITLAYQRFFKGKKNYELIINVQGDEPLFDKELLNHLITFYFANNYELVTVVKRKNQRNEEFLDPNKVKAVWCEQTGRCLYFSRSPIPYVRDASLTNIPWFLHIGAYGFKPEVLEKFSGRPESEIEALEKLEQLRFLEGGIAIELWGVDHPDDVKRIEEVLK
jgi:3-deoxy-manno-octulosonate cytidylyltransferase (CMP-KDO synthetase)